MNQEKFNELSLSDDLLNAINDVGYETMTQIQRDAIPLVLEGHDVIGRSNTGTGKTAAFSIPILEKLDDEADNFIRALIICPTRELAMQISEEMEKFSKYKDNVKITPVYGGQSMENQIKRLKKTNVVVGTPGRIMDHMRRRTIKLDRLQTIVLDEADEMLNMGFIDDIKLILSEVPDERQTLLFSATMPKAILNLTEEFLHEPKTVAVIGAAQTVDKIKQYYYDIPQNKKGDAVKLILTMKKPKRALIFCNTKNMVDDLVEKLSDWGFNCEGLHGDMSQNSRTKIMADYKKGRTKILIATDVAARGIDVNDIEAVINYDIPQETEYYIHRIGRTGRAGKDGAAYTLVANKMQARRIEDIMRITKAEIACSRFDDPAIIKENLEKELAEKIVAVAKDSETGKYDTLKDKLLQTGMTESKIIDGLLQMLDGADKSLFPKIEDFTMFNRRERAPREKRERGSSNVMGANIKKVRISMGRENNLAPNFIVGAIVDATGISAKSIGKITINRTYSTVEMHKDDALRVVEMMKSTKIKKQKVTITIDSDENPKRAFKDKGYNKSSFGRTRMEMDKGYSRKRESKNNFSSRTKSNRRKNRDND